MQRLRRYFSNVCLCRALIHSYILTSVNPSVLICLQPSSALTKCHMFKGFRGEKATSPYLLANVHQQPPRTLSNPQPRNQTLRAFTRPGSVQRSAWRRQQKCWPNAAAGSTRLPAGRVFPLSVQFARQAPRRIICLQCAP